MELMKKHNKILIYIKGLMMINIIWYALAVVINKNIVPKPTEVYSHMNALYGEKLYIHVAASFYRLFTGVGVAVLIGLIIGLAMGYSETWNKILNPLVYLTYPIPKIALLPVVMLLFGLGDSSKIIIIVLIIVFQVIVAVRDAVNNIDAENYNVLRSLGSSKAQVFANITLPAILPEVFTNIRVSIGTALSILFFAEGYGTEYGIGYYILDAWTRIDYIGMYAGIVAISLMGFSLFVGIDLLEAYLCKWRDG
jgi:NitT/TauT family transport system permease protein